jgi:hypothetical protein
MIRRIAGEGLALRFGAIYGLLGVLSIYATSLYGVGGPVSFYLGRNRRIDELPAAPTKFPNRRIVVCRPGGDCHVGQADVPGEGENTTPETGGWSRLATRTRASLAGPVANRPQVENQQVKVAALAERSPSWAGRTSREPRCNLVPGALVCGKFAHDGSYTWNAGGFSVGCSLGGLHSGHYTRSPAPLEIGMRCGDVAQLNAISQMAGFWAVPARA